MTLEFQQQFDIFLLLPCIAIGRVGDEAGKGFAIGWGFWIVSLVSA